MKKILIIFLVISISQISFSQSASVKQQMLELEKTKPNVFYSIINYAKKKCGSYKNKECVDERITVALYAYNEINREYSSKSCNELALAVSMRKNSYQFKFVDGESISLVDYVVAYGEYLEKYKDLTSNELYRLFPNILVKD